jgi:hypothetical protein
VGGGGGGEGGGEQNVPTASPTLTVIGQVVDTGGTGSPIDGTAVGAAVGSLVAIALLAVFMRRRSQTREEVYVPSDSNIVVWDRPIQSFTVTPMNADPDLTFEYDEVWNRSEQTFSVLPRGEPL